MPENLAVRDVNAADHLAYRRVNVKSGDLMHDRDNFLLLDCSQCDSMYGEV
jgi:hypothetical protein